MGLTSKVVNVNWRASIAGQSKSVLRLGFYIGKLVNLYLIALSQAMSNQGPEWW